MSSIITKTRNGKVYAYESTSYRDPVTGKPKAKQVYLGRVDPITNEIREKGKDGKRNRVSDVDVQDQLKSQIEERSKELEQANKLISILQKNSQATDELVSTLRTALNTFESSVSSASEEDTEEADHETG